jgi:Polyketide cyclase / dehydrase and lipid transport
MDGGGVPVTVTASARVPRAQAFHAIAPVPLERIFARYGPLPAVRGVREQTGAWDHVGASRIVELADGGEVRERLVAHDPPDHFAYRLQPLRGPLGRLVREGEGAWWFTAGEGDGAPTAIRWTYTFHPRRGARLPVRLVLAPLWRAYASRALAKAVAIAEEL